MRLLNCLLSWLHCFGTLTSSLCLLGSFCWLFLLPLRCQDQLCEGFPEVPGTEEEEDAEVGVGHDWEILPGLEEREWKEAVGQEDEVVDLADDPSHKVDCGVLLEQGLQPRAVVQHCEELKQSNKNRKLEVDGRWLCSHKAEQ